MNLLDLLIVALVVFVAVRGLRAGFFRQVGLLGGLVLGLVVGAMLSPVTARLGETAQTRSLIIIMVLLVTSAALAGIDEMLGLALAKLAHRTKLGFVDEAAGAGFGVVLGLVVVWVLSAMFMRVPSPGLALQVQDSTILRALDRNLPPPPDVLARVERLIAPNGFPRVFTGLEPSPAPPVTGPNAAAINQAATAARAATVRIQAPGCGGIASGTGFVVGPGLVMTNAHVVAGVRRAVVVDANGSHVAQPVAFDPGLDIAILRTTNLAGEALPLSSESLPRGTVGAVVGYPGGGPFTVSPAAVLGRQTAVGRDIYGRRLVRRQIYELQADVRPGNSGGPLVTPDGTVAGVIFAASLSNPGIGYAITSPQVLPYVERAASASSVSTGACTVD